jgi:serine/threonine protein kinase
MEEMIGKVVGSYTITGFVGEGGMGNVWEGRHPSIDRRVAIKVLHPQYARNEQVRERFRKEAAMLAKLQHPNIVALYDYVELPDQLCLVMEYVDGVNLDDLIRKQTGPLPNEKLGPLFKQMLSAIAYAHQNNVIHRDIKPANFMVTKDGTVKVLDFGIAKLLENDQQLTKTGLRMGTTFYMSPEQVNGLPVDHRTDIYSLGVTLFVLATGQLPFEATSTEFQVYSKIVNEPLPKPSAVYPGVSPNVELLIYKATAKNPAARFQTCEEFMVGKGIESARSANSGVVNSSGGNSSNTTSNSGNNSGNSTMAPSTPPPMSPPLPPAPVVASRHIGIRIFAIFSLVFMGLLALGMFGGAIYLMDLKAQGGMGYGYFRRSWDEDDLLAFNASIGMGLGLGLTFLMMAVSGIGILARGYWSRILGIVDLFVILLVSLLVGLVGLVLAVADDVPYEGRELAGYFYLAAVVLLGYCIWGLIALFSSNAGRYFRRQ